MSFDTLNVKLEDLFFRKFKHYKSMSRETPCWEAEVWIKKWPGDPVKLCSVRNSGDGGPDEVYPWSACDVLSEVAKQLPVQFYQGMELPRDYEAVLSKLFEQEENKRYLQPLLKKNTLFFLDRNYKDLKQIKGLHIGYVQKTFENRAEILNLMQFDEALAAYEKWMAINNGEMQ